MDGRRRLAEPVTDGAAMRPAAGAVPGPARRCARRPRAAAAAPLASARSRWSGIKVPRGVGIAAGARIRAGERRLWRRFAATTCRRSLDDLADVRDAAANVAGFRITSIALAGERRLSREEILDTAGVTARTSLLFLDASEARTRLKANPWIAEATVLKLYPGRLHIGIIERDAFALWQRDGKVEVIAEDGTVVGPYSSQPLGQAFAKLPLVVGAGAETRAKDFLTLLDKYPSIRGQLQAAVLVAERRWNLALNNGIEVRLPEAGVEPALDLLVKLDRDDKMLTRDIAAIDLRLSDRVTVQLSEEAAAARAEALKGKAVKKKGGAA